jgi:hypothetical protein
MEKEREKESARPPLSKKSKKNQRPSEPKCSKCVNKSYLLGHHF